MLRSLLLLFCLSASLLTGAPSLPTQTTPQPPYFEAAPCPVAVPDGTVCGNLVVAENRANPAGRTIRVAVVIIRSTSPSPQPDPIVYLEGGPGASALESAGFWASSPLREQRDIILFEQRGTHYSDPYLTCPEVVEVGILNFQRDLGFEAEIADEAGAAARCRDRLAAAGVDLSAYNSDAIAADLKDLRQALGIRQWNLYGVSYGTRAALEAMRADPTGIRAVVLDSVYPPEYNSLVMPVYEAGRAFDRVFAACQADPACQAAYPDLRERFYALVARLDASPIPITLTRADTHETVSLQMTGGDVAELIYFGMYTVEIIPYIPFMIENLERGNSAVLMPLLDMAVQAFTTSIANGMYYSVECYDRAGMDDPDLSAQLGANYPQLAHFTLFRALRAVCAVWGAGSPDPAEYLPVESSIPTLLLAGALDPITPPDTTADLTAPHLSNRFYYVFPARSHAVSFTPCADSVMRQFFDDPTRAPDTSCIASIQPVRFYTPGQLYPTPTLYLFSQRVLGGSSPFQLILLGVCLVFLLVEALLILLRGLRALLKRRAPAAASPAPARAARWVSGLGVLVNLLFLGGLVAVGFQTLTADTFMVAFGVPASARPLFWLPWIAALLALAVAGLCAWLWKSRTWTAGARVQYTLLALSLLGLAWLYLQWGAFL